MGHASGRVAFLVAFLGTVPTVASADSEGSGAPATDLSYIDSRGRRVELEPAPWRMPATSTGGRPRALFRTDHPDRFVHLRDGVLVRLASPSAVFPAGLAAMAGLQPERPIDRAATTWRCRTQGPEAALRASHRLWGQPGVAWALPDFGVPIALHGVPGDPYYPDQWYLRPQHSGTVNAEQAWSLTTGNGSVVIAIVDTGVDDRHPDLGSHRFRLGWDMLDQDPDPWPGPLAANAHGTHCAGIIGAAHNGRGIAGVCPGCGLMALRFLSGLPGDEHVPELSNAAEALHRAVDDGAFVVSNSWGVFDINKPKIDLAPLLEAARYAATHGGPDGTGALVVFSSGNQAKAIAPDDLAALPEVLSVGAVDPNDVRHEYSQYGPELDVVAPGGAAWWKSPQLVTLDTSGTTNGKGNGANKGDGSHYVSAALVEVRKDWPEADPSGEVTAYFNGTSSAAPIVAGIAGLMWSINPHLSAREVRRILEETCDPVGPVPYVEGRNDEYGHGRVNAGRAVRAARFGLDRTSGAPCSEHVNCASGECVRAPGALEGTCAGQPEGTDLAPNADIPGADAAAPDAVAPADMTDPDRLQPDVAPWPGDLPSPEPGPDILRPEVPGTAIDPGGQGEPEPLGIPDTRGSSRGCAAGPGSPSDRLGWIGWLLVWGGLALGWRVQRGRAS